MATAYTDAQVQGTAAVGTYATLYTTDASHTAILSTIIVCNTAAAAATFRIGLAATAGTPGMGNWLAYDTTVPANDTLILNVKQALSASKFVRVSSSASTVVFTASVEVRG